MNIQQQKNRKGGTVYKRLFRLFCLQLLLFSVINPVVAQTTQEQIRLFAEGGAPELAIAMIEKLQPEYNQDKDSWSHWEAIRVEILSKHSFWKALIDRIEHYPENLPATKKFENSELKANALLKLHRFAEAREVLHQLIWRGEQAYEQHQLSHWRRLIIESYLGEQKGEDAYLAMQRYHQDYGRNEKEALLSAKVLLASNHPEQAEQELLSLERTEQVENLLLLTTIRQQKRLRATLADAKRRLRSEDASNRQKMFLSAVIVEVAILINEYPSRIIALEQLYRLPESNPMIKELFNFKPDDLWNAYIEYAQQMANKSQLLQGDDDSWFKEAEESKKFLPVRSRSYLSYLAHKSLISEHQHQAHQLLIDRILGLNGGEHLLEKLYLESSYVDPVRDIPQDAAFLLLDKAIRENNLQRASRLIQQLDAPPKGTALFVWNLRKAKIFLLAAEIEPAIKAIENGVTEITKVTASYRDRLVQLIFDLQTVGEDRAALKLLTDILVQIEESEFKRELLYWIAEAHANLSEYVLSANYYLQSATLFDSKSMDPWAQTARYQAAKSLLKAGLRRDAETILTGLLEVTNDPARVAIIKRELEQVRLQR